MTGMRIPRILTHIDIYCVCMFSNLYNTNQDEIDIVIYRLCYLFSRTLKSNMNKNA